MNRAEGREVILDNWFISLSDKPYKADTEEQDNKEEKRAQDRLLNWRVALFDMFNTTEIPMQHILRMRETLRGLDLENKGFV